MHNRFSGILPSNCLIGAATIVTTHTGLRYVTGPLTVSATNESKKQAE